MSIPPWLDGGGVFVAACAHVPLYGHDVFVDPSERAHLPFNGTAAVSNTIFGEHVDGAYSDAGDVSTAFDRHPFVHADAGVGCADGFGRGALTGLC